MADTTKEFDIKEMILHHLADAKEWESPFGVVHLPQFEPVQLGPITLDFSITKHVLFMMIAAVVTLLVMLYAAAKAKREHAAGAERGPKGTTNVVEALILFIRDEVVMKNIGHGGEKYAPFIVTIFFFILFCNALGLVPWGASPTGNVSVTLALALMTFIVVEIAGMRTLGFGGYMKTIIYWPHDMPVYMKIPLTLILSPIEFLGKLTKPFALTVRLFANMVAGHVILLALMGMMFTFGIFGAPALEIGRAHV